MKTISFVWNDSTPLKNYLLRPVVGVSVRTLSHGRSDSATLWNNQGTGIKITSAMHDVADRREVGVLNFVVVDRAPGDPAMVKLPKSFEDGFKVFKLAIDESGTTVESGLVFEALDGQCLTIVAADYPHSLAIIAPALQPQTSIPEYPLDAYRRIPVG